MLIIDYEVSLFNIVPNTGMKILSGMVKSSPATVQLDQGNH